jgi:hypothetical protein
MTDTAVGYDGTWHGRKDTSDDAVGCVTDILTGLVIDSEIISKHCHACSST